MSMATQVLLKIRDHFFEKQHHSKSVPPHLLKSKPQLSMSVRDNNQRKTDNLKNEEINDASSEAHSSSDISHNGKVMLHRLRSQTESNLINSLSHFDRICTIGTGTFGRVVLVNQHNSSKYYALKVVSIRHVVHKHQVDHVHNEKNILQTVRNPFIVKLYWTWHDSKCLYLLFEYIPGGELFSYLRASQRFSPNTARFYSCELISALEYLHYLDIVYRDLKPENLLLDKYGHVKICDFGFAKVLRESKTTYTLCGTPEYLAPELIEQKGHDRSVDWWGMGVLIYEMMVGHPPFRGSTVLQTYEQILEGIVKFPKNFHPLAKDLVRKFLHVDRTMRLGAGVADATEVKDHRWYKDVDWIEVYHRRIPPPIVPTLYHDGDTGNYDAYNEHCFNDFPTAPDKELAFFKHF